MPENQKHKKNIYVTQPSLPDLEEFIPYLREIWESKILTNQGKFHEQFEIELAKYLRVKYVSLVSNGTLALIVALQALRITGEVITTPFSFVATTHALHWNEITPVFCDIESKYNNINPDKIESLITPKTTAILPVHVYGYPCNIERIQNIADIYGLKVIYDAAHTFGAKYKNQSIASFGDLSILSFHATKVFNTFEGGAIVCHDEIMKKRIDFLKNFGFAGETTVVAPGINAKMNEFQAALGLLQLKNIDNSFKKRKEISNFYNSELSNIEGISLILEMDDLQYNHAYFPIFVDDKEYGISRDKLYEKLKACGILSRRYFYPLISQFPTYKNLSSSYPGKLPIAERKTKQVLCLPIYPDLELDNVKRIIDIIKTNKA